MSFVFIENISELFAISSLINGVASMALGVAIISGGGFGRVLNRIFFLFTLSISLWSVGYFFWLSSSSVQSALLWIGILNVGAVFIPTLQYHWVVKALGIHRRGVYIGYALSVFFAVIPFTEYAQYYIANTMEIMGFSYWPQAGPLYIAYIVFIYIGFFGLGVWEAGRAFLYRKDESIRGIARYIFWAMLFASVAGLTNFPLWFGVELIPYGNIFVFLYVFLLAYAIFRYNFMEVRQALVTLTTVAVGSLLIVDIVVDAFKLSESIGPIIRVFALFFFLYFARLIYKSFERETEQREQSQKLSEDLKVANERLVRLDKAKSDMLSIAAHQLRTPLTAMNGYLSLILDGSAGEAIGVRTNDMVTKVSRATSRLSALVNNLLNMSRIDDGRMQYVMHPVNIEDMLRETAETFDILAQSQGLRLVVNLPDAPLKKVLIDDNKMHEVISNLINNAIKYTKEGTITVRAWQHDDHHIRFSVSDTGVGIPESVLSKLFSKFSRADREQLNTEGAGIGLYVCYNIVHDHGGRIWVESEGEGKGAEFVVELKTADVQAEVA